MAMEENALIKAINEGASSDVEQLMKCAAEYDAQDLTAIDYAVLNGNAEVIRVLLGLKEGESIAPRSLWLESLINRPTKLEMLGNLLKKAPKKILTGCHK